MRIDFEACFLYIVYNDDITSDRTKNDEANKS